MQAQTQQRQNQATHFGGIFAPLAQYPGASYAKILSEKIEQHSFTPRPTKREKILVRSKTPYMKNMSKNILPFKSALLIVDMENNASLDRSALRDAGIKYVRVLTSGLQAAKILSSGPSSSQGEGDNIDIVFCHARFDDMSAVQWIELIRTHPALKSLPVVALVGSSVEEHFLQNLDFTAIMARPYSPKILHDKLADIDHVQAFYRNVESPVFDAALQRFESCNTEDGKASFYMEEGMRFVQQKEWDSAIQAFNKSMIHPTQKGDSELGIAAAWRGKQDIEKFRYYVYEAGLTFARAGQWSKARTAYSYMLKAVPKAPSPFVRIAQSYVRAGEYAKAAQALIKGIDLSPHENVANYIAKACLYTENPPYTLQKVKQFFVDPILQDIVKALDENLQQAFEARQDTVSKGREERARLEAKAKEYNANKANATSSNAVKIKSVVDLEDELEDDDFGPLYYDEDSDESILESIPGNPSLMQDDYVKKEQGKVLQLMNEDDMESQLFTSFPKLNEAATVIKTTLKLMKK